jgi:hypothetical protein
MAADATPALYIDQLKRLGNNGIQAYFALAHVHSLEIVEGLIHQGLHMGPVNDFYGMVSSPASRGSCGFALRGRCV